MYPAARDLCLSVGASFGVNREPPICSWLKLCPGGCCRPRRRRRGGGDRGEGEGKDVEPTIARVILVQETGSRGR